MTKPAICFVTNELYPLGPGGIGRMLHNFARHNETLGSPAEIHFLVPPELLASRPDAPMLLAGTFDGLAQVHICPDLANRPDLMAQLLARAGAHPWTLEWHLAESYRYYQGLLAAERRRGAPFDIVEFPDFGGWAVASIEAKRAGLAFTQTLIAARIHSTQGVIYRAERFTHHPGHSLGIVFDAERHLLAHADLIVGHERTVLAFNEDHYGLAGHWRGRCLLEFPPILPDDGDAPVQAEREPLDFIFSSRLQPFKRPDLFIRAAILFLERHPDHAGCFRLVSYGWDEAYIAGLRALVPETLKEKILFVFGASAAERASHLARSVVVVPSDYESLCLFAFEASRMGCKIILNGRCPAFGKTSRWQDENNCLLFDGSVAGLAAAMEKALRWTPSATASIAPDTPYWLRPAAWPVSRAPAVAQVKRPGVTVVCHGIRSPAEFERLFDTVLPLDAELDLAGGTDAVQVLLPRGHFAPDGPEARRVEAQGWQAVLSSGKNECPEMLGRRLAALEREAVLLHPFGFEAAPGFLALALDAMARDAELALVCGHVELVDPHTARSDYLRAYAGEAPSTALLSSRIAPPFCLLRRDLPTRVPFDPRAGDLWFEVFARECALTGEGILVMPVIAATMDAFLAGRRETTKKISGGLTDAAGIAVGLPARLLSLDPVQPPGDGPDRPLTLHGEQLRPVSRIHPQGRVREWEPVQWHGGSRGIIVHPLAGEVTIGELRGPHRRVGRIVAHVRNLSEHNGGVEAAVALARGNAATQRILARLDGGEMADDVALSAWQTVGPGRQALIELSAYGTSRGNDRLLLITRLPPRGEESDCHLAFERVELWFNENIL